MLLIIIEVVINIIKGLMKVERMICPYLANCKENHNEKCWKNFEDCELYDIGGFENFINKVVFKKAAQTSE